MTIRFYQIAGAATLALLSQPALAAPGGPVAVGSGLTIDPIIDARLRYEAVNTPTLEADAATLRLRAGAELRHESGLAVLAEAESTLALVDDYNAFPFVIASRQRRPQFAVVADPANVELNRLQVQYKTRGATLTLGRQRINVDDQRWIGNGAGWRQNEQTYDAVRGEGQVGPMTFDVAYSTSQRTGLGFDAGPRTAYDGRFTLLGAGTRLGPVNFKAFAYLLDYDAAEQAGALATTNADTQTYGARATAAFKLSPKITLNLAASYARQSDWQGNPARYGADYLAGEAGLGFGSAGLTTGVEVLGSDNGHAVQTPMAALHKFNGWADLFLTTPAAGLQDWYAGASYRFAKVSALPGLNAAVTFHRFESDAGALHYGDEWDASLGFKLGRANLLAKYADYNAATFGADTRKVWLQLELAY